MRLEKLLVPVDFSKSSEMAFHYAKSLAKKFSASIHLLHVVDKRYVERIAELSGESEEEVSRKLSLQAKEKLANFLSKNGSDGVADERNVAVGIVFQTIALKAQALGADLIIMGGHGRVGNGQIDKIFFGSTAERVVRLLPCPVLCVPQ
jgi:nucleotide-binding universal stress UspA family protein